MSHPAAPSDPPTRILELPTGPVGFTSVGSGPTLIAIHGGPGSVRDWRWLGPVVEPHLRFVRLDMPGFAATPLSVSPDPSAAARADFVLQVADALRIDGFAVMGHSLGGSIALEVAARAPDRTTGLALVGSVGLRVHRARRRARGLDTWVRLLRGPRTGPLMRPLLGALWGAAGFPRSTPDAEKVVTLALLAAQDFDANAATALRVRAPTFVAWTRDDPLIEEAIPTEAGAALPDGPRLAFDDGGHNLQKTQADAIGRALVAWLTETVPVRPPAPGA